MRLVNRVIEPPKTAAGAALLVFLVSVQALAQGGQPVSSSPVSFPSRLPEGDTAVTNPDGSVSITTPAGNVLRYYNDAHGVLQVQVTKFVGLENVTPTRATNVNAAAAGKGNVGPSLNREEIDDVVKSVVKSAMLCWKESQPGKYFRFLCEFDPTERQVRWLTVIARPNAPPFDAKDYTNVNPGRAVVSTGSGEFSVPGIQIGPSIVYQGIPVRVGTDVFGIRFDGIEYRHSPAAGSSGNIKMQIYGSTVTFDPGSAALSTPLTEPIMFLGAAATATPGVNSPASGNGPRLSTESLFDARALEHKLSMELWAGGGMGGGVESEKRGAFQAGGAFRMPLNVRYAVGPEGGFELLQSTEQSFGNRTPTPGSSSTFGTTTSGIKAPYVGLGFWGLHHPWGFKVDGGLHFPTTTTTTKIGVCTGGNLTNPTPSCSSGTQASASTRSSRFYLGAEFTREVWPGVGVSGGYRFEELGSTPGSSSNRLNEINIAIHVWLAGLKAR